jgi:histidine triad (HIT) family protein
MTHIESPDCIFCKIVSNTMPAVKVYEDENTLAFLDIQPANFGHVLVVPKDHFENIYVVPAEEWCRVNLVAQNVALAVKHGADADGVNLIMNNESAAGQVVPHAHIHIIPRYNEDGLKHWDHKTYKDAEQMSEIAEKIRGFVGK